MFVFGWTLSWTLFTALLTLGMFVRCTDMLSNNIHLVERLQLTWDFTLLTSFKSLKMPTYRSSIAEKSLVIIDSPFSNLKSCHPKWRPSLHSLLYSVCECHSDSMDSMLLPPKCLGRSYRDYGPTWWWTKSRERCLGSRPILHCRRRHHRFKRPWLYYNSQVQYPSDIDSCSYL